MSSFHLRFVGAVELPKSLSEMDVDESFRLSEKDIADVREKFKGARLGAALQLVFIRATGRSLDKVTGIPRALLKSLCISLALNDTAIATLKTLYKRSATRFAHQKWAREASGLSPADESTLKQLADALTELSAPSALTCIRVKASAAAFTPRAIFSINSATLRLSLKPQGASRIRGRSFFRLASAVMCSLPVGRSGQRRDDQAYRTSHDSHVSNVERWPVPLTQMEVEIVDNLPANRPIEGIAQRTAEDEAVRQGLKSSRWPCQ